MFGNQEKLLRDGQQGQGVILTVKSREAYAVPFSYEVTVRAHFDDGTTAEIETVFHVLKNGLMKQELVLEPEVGDIVPTRFDPADHRHVVVDIPALAAKREAAHGAAAQQRDEIDADAIKRSEDLLSGHDQQP